MSHVLAVKRSRHAVLGRQTIAFVVLLSSASVLRAQSTNASLAGRVTDPSNAIIVGASVAAISDDTNIRHETTTNTSGEYYLGNLPPRSYRIEIAKTGFRTLAGTAVGMLLEDRDGVIWTTSFGNRWTLCEVQKARATCHGNDGGAGEGALGLYEDRTGRLWVGTGTGLWRWKPGPPMFYPLGPENNGLQGLSGDGNGALLVSKAGGIRRFVDGRAEMVYPFPPSVPPLEALRLRRDRDGGLWAGTNHGVVHVHNGITDVFSQTDGLSGDDVSAILEDREGNIWIATDGGLDRFRASAVVSYSALQGLSSGRVMSVLASIDGSVWVGTSDGLNRWANGDVTVYRERSAPVAPGSRPLSRTVREFTGAGMPRSVGPIFEDSQRRVGLSTADGVGYLENDRVVLVNGIPGGVTRAIVEDSQKNLWIANPTVGLFRLGRNRRDVEQTSWAVLKHKDVASAVAVDPSGDGLWFGFFRGGIVHFAEGQVRVSYAAADGLADGRVSNLYADSAGALWIATDGGLSRLENGRLATMNSNNGLPCDAVGWVVEDAVHALWLGMPCGLVRIDRSEIDAWTAAARPRDENAVTPRVKATVFDHADGVRTFASASYYTAPAAVSADGKVWFMSQEGLSVIDPARLSVNALPPPVHIEQVIVDRQTYDPTSARGGRLQLPPLTRDLQIDYTALSLVAPEKVQFRYRLEGWDRDWQDVGNRRQAFYANLPPRVYRFRVIASNNSGVWNETGASIDFSVAPAYYQSTWFPVLVAGVVLGLVWSAHRIRVGIFEKHQREISALNERLMKAQEQERIRIAGELHDGVMQQMLAATMMLGTAKRRIADVSEATATIDKVQQKLIEMGTDIRQLSHDLHPPILQEAGLAEAMRAYCQQFSASSGVAVACDADDRAADLSRGAALALFRIVQEALGNAAKHARAKRITVRLTRSAEAVSLEVSDDGAGFDPGQLGASGGLGLVMMRERATQLNGTFEFDSAPGRGTTIRVTIPFR
jgi:signal transduction histidine kinase/ligand-binding sensor domain-containing protein